MFRKPWTTAEAQTAVKLRAEGKTYREIAVALHRTPGALIVLFSSRGHSLQRLLNGEVIAGRKTKQPWTYEELAKTREMLDAGLPYSKISRELGRNIQEVRAQFTTELKQHRNSRKKSNASTTTQEETSLLQEKVTERVMALLSKGEFPIDWLEMDQELGLEVGQSHRLYFQKATGEHHLEWLPAEDDRLLAAVKKRTMNWSTVTASLPQLIKTEVAKHGNEWQDVANFLTFRMQYAIAEARESYDSRIWEAVAEEVGTRDAKRCKLRWKKFVDPEIKAPWTFSEDDQLRALVKQHGMDFAKIAVLMVPQKTAASVRQAAKRLGLVKKT
ncbi:hypothetical protein HK104_004550 [Borealophlyctis nickersoniae]|nr:hypothetical protein HK104_004550 [Borealophlyctis nickersoniae]